MSFTCTRCEECFKRKQNLKRHLDRKYPCKEKKVKKGKIIKKDIENIHKEDVKLSRNSVVDCDFCKQNVSTKNIKRHYRNTCTLIPENKRQFFINKYNNNKKHINTEKYNVIEATNINIASNKPIEIDANTIIKRKKIPKSVKDTLWDSLIGKEFGVGKCYVCLREIDCKTFDCGHIQSVANGGSDKIDNLKPICKTCNSSMATMNMETFRNLYHGNTVVIQYCKFKNIECTNENKCINCKCTRVLNLMLNDGLSINDLITFKNLIL